MDAQDSSHGAAPPEVLREVKHFSLREGARHGEGSAPAEGRATQVSSEVQANDDGMNHVVLNFENNWESKP